MVRALPRCPRTDPRFPDTTRVRSYRTLTAVDSAVMVIDAARGIEAQTRKLFEVCRLRNVPIITFVNKVDREGRAPFELLDEIADVLALDVDRKSTRLNSSH